MNEECFLRQTDQLKGEAHLLPIEIMSCGV
jgi:hypothetical protein